MQTITHDNWVLVDMDTLAPIDQNSRRQDFRGDTQTIRGGRPPQHSASTGRVWTASGGEFYPSVFNLKWVENTQSGEEVGEKPEKKFLAEPFTVSRQSDKVGTHRRDK